MSGQRYIRLFTEPPKESEWRGVGNDLEGALKRNVQRVQRRAGTAEGRRENIYLGDPGTALMEITMAERRDSLPDLPPESPESQEDRNLLSPHLLKSFADHHIASVFYNSTWGLQSIRSGGHISFLETPIGVATLVLSRYPIGEQKIFATIPWRRSLNLFQGAIDAIEEEDKVITDDDGCEVLYGRAGFLYALLRLRRAVKKERRASSPGPSDGGRDPDSEASQNYESCKGVLSDETLGSVVRSIIQRGKYGAQIYRSECGEASSPPLMWSWHGKRYLGGAHGMAGILQMLLRCPPSIIAEYMPEIVQTIDWLVGCQDRAGNWPTKAPALNQTASGELEEHELVQWCHGATAILILLSTILRLSITPGVTTGLTDPQKDRFVVPLQRGCAVVYMHGLLRKGVGLCHGVAGSVYALLSASDALDEPCAPSSSEPTPPTAGLTNPEGKRPYFTQAAHLAHLATYTSSLVREGRMTTPDHPWSLYEGMAGMCCAWEEILYRLENRGKCFSCSGMPGYDDLAVE